MELKEKLELLNEKSSIAEVQQYIKDMKKARKFDGVTIEREMMLFIENKYKTKMSVWGQVSRRHFAVKRAPFYVKRKRGNKHLLLTRHIHCIDTNSQHLICRLCCWISPIN